MATVVFGLSRTFWLSLAMMFVCGAMDNVSVVVRHTLVQVLTPDEMRGRVSAVNSLFIGASNEFGRVRVRSGGEPGSVRSSPSSPAGSAPCSVVVATACDLAPICGGLVGWTPRKRRNDARFYCSASGRSIA